MINLYAHLPNHPRLLFTSPPSLFEPPLPPSISQSQTHLIWGVIVGADLRQGVERSDCHAPLRAVDEIEENSAQETPCCNSWLARIIPSSKHTTVPAGSRGWLCQFKASLSLLPRLLFWVFHTSLFPRSSASFVPFHLALLSFCPLLSLIVLQSAVLSHRSICTYRSLYTKLPYVSSQHSFHEHAFSIWCGLGSCRFILARAPLTNYHARCLHIFDFTFTWLENSNMCERIPQTNNGMIIFPSVAVRSLNMQPVRGAVDLKHKKHDYLKDLVLLGDQLLHVTQVWSLLSSPTGVGLKLVNWSLKWSEPVNC